jgi:hypothetical protein
MIVDKAMGDDAVELGQSSICRRPTQARADASTRP